MDVIALTNKIRHFAKEREWDQFHSPRNIASSISVESAELLEIFQWSKGQSWKELSDKSLRDKTEDELADIFIYLVRFADLADIDLEKVAWRKVKKNARKYPVTKFKGNDKKYNQK